MPDVTSDYPLSVKDAAAALGVTGQTIASMFDRGELKGSETPQGRKRILRFRPEDIEAVKAKREAERVERRRRATGGVME